MSSSINTRRVRGLQHRLRIFDVKESLEGQSDEGMSNKDFSSWCSLHTPLPKYSNGWYLHRSRRIGAGTRKKDERWKQNIFKGKKEGEETIGPIEFKAKELT
jgi:hypothetical protein